VTRRSDSHRATAGDGEPTHSRRLAGRRRDAGRTGGAVRELIGLASHEKQPSCGTVRVLAVVDAPCVAVVAPGIGLSRGAPECYKFGHGHDGVVIDEAARVVDERLRGTAGAVLDDVCQFAVADEGESGRSWPLVGMFGQCAAGLKHGRAVPSCGLEWEEPCVRDELCANVLPVVPPPYGGDFRWEPVQSTGATSDPRPQTQRRRGARRDDVGVSVKLLVDVHAIRRPF
jgi:hypothetical protein